MEVDDVEVDGVDGVEVDDVEVDGVGIDAFRLKQQTDPFRATSML